MSPLIKRPVLKRIVFWRTSGVEERGLGGWSSPSRDLMGAEPPNLIFLELSAYKNRYSVIRGHFRFRKLSLSTTLHSHFLIYVLGFNFKISYKDACKKRAP